MFPSQEEIFTAIEPVAKQMQEIGSNSMKVTLRDGDDNAVITIVVAKEDKASLVDKAMDFVDEVYDMLVDRDATNKEESIIEEDFDDFNDFDDDDFEDWDDEEDY